MEVAASVPNAFPLVATGDRTNPPVSARGQRCVIPPRVGMRRTALSWPMSGALLPLAGRLAAAGGHRVGEPHGDESKAPSHIMLAGCAVVCWSSCRSDVVDGHAAGQDEFVFGLEMVVLLGVALVACGALARRYPIAPAILLVLVGVLVGFVPHIREAQLPPEVVLVVFLPALLYWESLTTSLREIRYNLRVVVLTSTALVAATAAAVAAAAHGLGLAWGPAWVLGAALAPTDATAVGVLAGDLPRRTVTVLRAESLVNDGTALVLYGLAVGVTVGEQQLTGWHVTWLLVWSYVGGVLAGAPAN